MKEILIEILTMCFLITALLVSIGIVISLVKNEFTYRNHMIIADAIYYYNLHLIKEGQYDIYNTGVTFDDMEDYDATQKRFWDWGYKRILPPEKFELIKPFVKYGKGGE